MLLWSHSEPQAGGQLWDSGYAHETKVKIPAPGGATGRATVSRDTSTRDSMNRSVLSSEGHFKTQLAQKEFITQTRRAGAETTELDFKHEEK